MVKVSDLTAETAPDSADVMLLTDVGSGSSKKVTIANLFANIPDGSVTPADLVTGAGTSWTWQSWTPTWTNLTIGNATVEGKYTRVGKTGIARLIVTFGTTTAVSGDVSFSLPATSISYGTANLINIGTASLFDGGSTIAQGYVTWSTTTTANLRALTASGTYVTQANLSSTVPHTWNTGDTIGLVMIYEVA